MTLKDILEKYKNKEIKIDRTQNLFITLDNTYSGHVNYYSDIHNVSFDAPLKNKPDCLLHFNIQITNNIYSIITYYLNFGDNFNKTVSKNPIKFSLNIIKDDYKRLINAINYLIAETNNRINNIKKEECISLFNLYIKDSICEIDKVVKYQQIFEKYINSENSLNIYNIYDFLKNISKNKKDKEILLYFLDFFIFGNIADAIEIKFLLIYGANNFLFNMKV